MTKKQATIAAHRELVEKYRITENNFDKDTFLYIYFSVNNCPLCVIHCVSHENYSFSCRGCPLANTQGGVGCKDFKSYKTARTAHWKALQISYLSYTTPTVSSLSEKEYKALQKAFEKRAQFHENIIPILKEMPAKLFTKNGWKYFEELDRNW